MTVMHLGDESSWRGGENQIRLLAEGLRASGIESVIAYPKGSAMVRRLGPQFPMVELPSRAPLDPRNHWVLSRAVSRYGITLLDAHSSTGHSMALKLKKSHPQLKLVVHRRVAFPIKTGVFSRAKYMSPLIDRYVCISHAIAEVVLKYGIALDKVRVVRSAVEHEPYQAMDSSANRLALKQRLGLKSDAVLVGNASALTAEKGNEVLIEALARIKDRPFHCVLAGDGAERARLEEAVSNHGLKDKVTFLGFVENVREVISALDVMAVPSRNEGLGTVILEGALAGTALVASQAGGIPEIVKHRETGLLVTPGDAGELAQALDEVIGDESLRDKLAANAKSYVREEFSVENMVQGNLRVYRELI